MATIHASTFAANDDPLRKRVLCDGTLLVGNQAVNLVGAPGARKITNQIHSIVKSLKPHILQAPESNDRDAQEQAARTRLHAFLVENTANRLNNFETIKPDEYTAALLMLIQQLHDGLDGTHAELQDLYDQQGVVKFACQSEIKRRLDKHREESRERVIQFCFESILLMNHVIAQSYADVHLVGRQFDDVKLNYDTKFEWLEREVSAMRSARRTDERCSAMCIALERNVFFLV